MIAREELEQAFDARFPSEVRDKLRAGRVAVAGLGGLGSHIAVMLARCGVGHLFLVDFDRVDTTNLNRQAYRIPHLGDYKTDALPALLREINPYLEIRAERVLVTEDNAASLFRGYPIVCEAFDRPENKAMLVSVLLARCPEVTVVSGVGMAGYGGSNEIRTRQAMKRLYVCGDGITDVGDGMGLMAPRVAICAGHQANKVIELILNRESEGIKEKERTDYGRQTDSGRP